jgi:hypothetical protein
MLTEVWLNVDVRVIHSSNRQVVEDKRSSDFKCHVYLTDLLSNRQQWCMMAHRHTFQTVIEMSKIQRNLDALNVSHFDGIEPLDDSCSDRRDRWLPE